MVANVNTYNQEKMKEDVSDIIFNISPTDVPFQASARVGSSHNRTIEWNVDELAPENAENKLVEGADTLTASDTPAVSVQQNYHQIMTKTAIVSATADAVDFYGRKKELAYNLSKKGLEMRRDYEAALVGDDTAIGAIGDAVTARRLKPFQELAATNIVAAGGVGTALLESDYLTLLQTMYDLGADPTHTYVSSAHAQVIASWASSGASGATASVGRRRDLGNGKAIVNCVDFYMSPYGQTDIYINRFQDKTNLIVADMDYVETPFLRNPVMEKLAKTGDAEKRLLVMEASLKLNSLDAGGFISGLSLTGL